MRKLGIEPGETFNRLTAVRFVDKNKWNQSQWLFKCACGVEKILNASGVKLGGTKSCGCATRDPGPSVQINSGDKFSRLTAIRFVEILTPGKPKWLFKCDCGSETITIAPHVKSGQIKSCGCSRNPMKAGEVHGNWTAIQFASKQDNHTNVRWLFKCACGNERAVSVGSVRAGLSKSCGCLQKPTENKMRIDRIFKTIKAGSVKRGMSFILIKSDIEKLAERQNWKCLQTGISFDFTQGEGRRPFGPTIDRIDNTRGYEPGNIQLVCNLYNYCKNEHTTDDVFTFASALVEHHRILQSIPKMRTVA